MGGMVVLVAVAVASHLTRDDTLTVGQVLRLAGQFRAFRPGALVGLTIPTVPALRRNNVVLRPGLGSPTVLSWSGSSSHGVPVSCNALGRVSAQLAQGLDERVGADLFKPWRSRWNLRLVCGEIVVCRHRRGATGGQSARCGTSLASRAGHWNANPGRRERDLAGRRHHVDTTVQPESSGRLSGCPSPCPCTDEETAMTQSTTAGPRPAEPGPATQDIAVRPSSSASQGIWSSCADGISRRAGPRRRPSPISPSRERSLTSS